MYKMQIYLLRTDVKGYNSNIFVLLVLSDWFSSGVTRILEKAVWAYIHA